MGSGKVASKRLLMESGDGVMGEDDDGEDVDDGDDVADESSSLSATLSVEEAGLAGFADDAVVLGEGCFEFDEVETLMTPVETCGVAAVLSPFQPTYVLKFVHDMRARRFESSKSEVAVAVGARMLLRRL